MGAVEPAGVVIVSTSYLYAAVAGAVSVGLETQSQDEVAVLVIREKPDVIMVLVADGVRENCAVLDVPELFVSVGGFALYRPAGEIAAIKERCWSFAVSGTAGNGGAAGQYAKCANKQTGSGYRKDHIV